MSNAQDESTKMLRDYMAGSLARVIDALDAQDALGGITARIADQDDWDALDEGVQDYLKGLDVEPDEYGEWDHESAAERIREDLDPLAITWEKGEPFDVALTIGGPNIYLVDMGGFGGAQLRGAWGSGWEIQTGSDVTRALDYYRQEMEDIYGD